MEAYGEMFGKAGSPITFGRKKLPMPLVTKDFPASNGFYCCECKVLCGVEDLILDGAHKEHDYVYAVEAAVLVRDELNSHAEATRAALPRYAARLHDLNKKKTDLEAMITTGEETVREQFKILHEKLEKRKNILINDIRTVRTEKLTVLEGEILKMSQSIDRCSTTLAQLTDFTKELESVVLPQQTPVMKIKDDAANGSLSQSLNGCTLLEKTIEIPQNQTPEIRKRSVLSMREKTKREKKIKKDVVASTAASLLPISPTVKRNPPPLLTPCMANFVKCHQYILQTMRSIQSGGYCDDSEVSKIEVFFTKHLEVEVIKYGKCVVHQTGFRSTSRSNYGGVRLRPEHSGEKGLIWWLGTMGDSEPFRNPCLIGMAKLISSSVFDTGEALDLLSKDPQQTTLSNNIENSSLTWVLNPKTTIILTHVSIRHGASSSTRALRSFTVEVGSSETALEPVLLVENDESIGTEPYKVSTYPTERLYKAYGTIRLTMTAPNSSALSEECWKICLAGVEFYGTLYTG